MLYRYIIALTALTMLAAGAPVPEPNACARDVLGKRCCHCNGAFIVPPALDGVSGTYAYAAASGTGSATAPEAVIPTATA
ncbi:hypothetical protein EXIGLDRAFT_735788 [Exidia glandulosa HHB12029]|uniref:CBM1 domain-containing protein n=1 Tax=Exidia glandulosa HHB12029 TaxID=1314781 RepID=A0A165PKZ5_EXIGL|nr:hypothetical protein EXIGLDRAFT_735788 [Exidia glandulosa HHB12029]